MGEKAGDIGNGVKDTLPAHFSTIATRALILPFGANFIEYPFLFPIEPLPAGKEILSKYLLE